MADTDPRMELDKGNMLERIQERYGSLRPSERVVADFLRQSVGRRLDSSITELARTLGVSEATVSRVSRALGYDGYPDMKLSLAAATRSHRSYVNLPLRIEDGDTLITTSGKLSVLLTAGVEGTQRLLDADRLELTVRALEKARKIAFVGVGGAAAIGHEAAHMFMKAGFEAYSYSDGYTQTIVAATMTPEDVMVGISHTGTTETVAQAMALSRENGATTIAVTSAPSSIVAASADVVLVTWSADQQLVPLYGDFLEGRIGQLFLIDLLYVGTLSRAGGRMAESLRVTGAALAERYRHRRGESG